MLKRDPEATRAAHFENHLSYIAPDGREVLYGVDWIARKYQVWCRGGGKCEQRLESVVLAKESRWVNVDERCRSEMAHVHHKIKRSKQRDDRLSNLEGLCKLHHELKHPEKMPRWSSSVSRKPIESSEF